MTPDPRYLYMSERHREGLAQLIFGVSQPGGFVQLTGEVGTGKTTLCRCLLAQLPPKTQIAILLNPRLTAQELLATVCDELRVAYSKDTKSIKDLVDALHQYLLAAHARGQSTVLIIDEAQNLSASVLEQIRLLTNLETATQKLLQIVLIGQPELARLLERPHLRQLSQRITARYHLLPLSKRETVAYICHRLRTAGGSEHLFTPRARRRVHRLSGGVPRLINVLCDRALLGAYAHRQSRVDASMVVRAAREVRGLGGWRARCPRLAWASGFRAAGVLAGVALLAVSGHILLPQGVRAPWVTPSEARPGPVTHATGEEAARPEGIARGPAHLGGGAASAGGGTEAPPRLAELLADPSRRGNERPALASLYARWGVTPKASGVALGCKARQADGLSCLARAGNWTRLRRFDLPVALELTTKNGDRHWVALLALGENSATIEIGGREYAFPLSEVDGFWDGPFILLWKPPPFEFHSRAPGSRGKDVEWIRRRLDAMDGATTGVARPEIYDDRLRERVEAFQQSRFLVPDGIVGEETWVLLTLGGRGPETPSLSRRTP